MQMIMKTNVLLALVEQGASVFKAILSDYTLFFKNHQGSFRGVKKTYSPRPDTMDEPSMRGNTQVVTTVEEKLSWLVDNIAPYLDNRLSIEATNASGLAVAPLVVDGVEIAILTSQELLCLKNFLENREVTGMYNNIPVRSDAELWEPTVIEEYVGRDIYQQKLMEGVKKSLLKEQYILQDPNVAHLKDSTTYRPVVATKDTPIELGDWTSQFFSGEWTHTKRANLLKRKNTLYLAVLEALKKANEVEAVPSKIKAERILNYLHKGSF